jgi:acetyl-CoA carboxylase carboxyl transferase alpha subunit/acetyl-CoA carboxylase carboxyl transferase beta subunit
MTDEILFTEVATDDFLEFSFGGRKYADQIAEAVQKTKQFCAVQVSSKSLVFGDTSIKVVWCQHDFAFLGGSLGCAEGEKVTRAFEYATANKMPVIVACRTGGARMQEGTLSLMQMAKVSVAVDAHRRAGLPFVSVLEDPTYGGVSASYAMQADVKIAISGARIGFAGPGVILNTMFEMDQAKYDAACPDEFQSAEYLRAHGAVDLVISADPDSSDKKAAIKASLEGTVVSLCSAFTSKSVDITVAEATKPTEEELAKQPDYTLSRKIDRPQAIDMIQSLTSDFVELSGDGRVAIDPCLRGGVAKFQGVACVVMGCTKGHTPGDMEKANYGMPSPAGYRTALRLFQLAERFHLPVITFVDTPGAWPSFPAEESGQSEAIASNLTIMAGLKTPIITVVIGEGGSGGALGIAMGNSVGMLSQGYYGVISPEGAASILGKYKDDAHKATQFPKDCQELATAQNIYAYQLTKLGVVDEVIFEDLAETHNNFPVTKARIVAFVTRELSKFATMSSEEIVAQRYTKYRALGRFLEMTSEVRESKLQAADALPVKERPAAQRTSTPCKLIKHLANEVIHGQRSRFQGLAPAGMVTTSPSVPDLPPAPVDFVNAKFILDRDGPEAMAKWVRAQSEVLLTDTTMRDAHQSLLATRARTIDLEKSASIASKLLYKAFSFECWGGATFDVAYRFLDEDPWERLRAIRAAAPNVCTQMLVRGANAVGYTSYPDNVVEEFCTLAAKAGMDIFRIFDCFNDVNQMKVCIDAVRATGKVAEVCVCYTSDITTSEIYNIDYYREVAKKCAEAGAHMIGIKDMAGLLKPAAAQPLVDAIRGVCDLPIHFHTHATSSASLAVAIEMARAGADIIDFAVAAMADLTSQPSLNAFCAAMEGNPRYPKVDYMTLEPYDMFWMKTREMYSPFETGMLAGSARVFDHEIPGGQYANLFVQCASMGLGDKWADVLDMYRDVNKLFGDIVKVTPSSKCVGDLALYLINKGLSASDVVDPSKAKLIDFPDSSIGLMEGRLGFPHRGFPEAVSKAILKDKKPLTERPSAALPPADFEGTRAALSKKFGKDLDADRTMSALLYPKVFDDYMKFCAEKSAMLALMPTPVYFYSFGVGQSVTIEKVPSDWASSELGLTVPEGETIDVAITLKRVGPSKAGKLRTVIFDVNGQEQQVEVKDKAAEGEFDGPMAVQGNSAHVPSPMPGVVDKVCVKVGDTVAEGDPLFTVSAMKMAVEVKALSAGTVKKVIVKEGDKVVEGCLLASF